MTLVDERREQFKKDVAGLGLDSARADPVERRDRSSAWC